MAVTKIETFFAQRQQQIPMQVHLYALVDGLLYSDAESATPLARSAATVALFDGTPDASIADAGPWLIDHAHAPTLIRSTLDNLATSSTGVSWLISAYPIESLADELRRRLDVRLPDGRMALLRFYDARIMPDMASLMEFTQRMRFFVTTYDWLVEVNGHLKGVHPHA
ncbi:DUF4123 domain-containing protein [Trinickia terrae]|uniref:DUF4123 domain-containing protein n=1 Tax=Trinickia terrae TaxID=2571161 RepID=A0A4U1HQU1_9BURK|nr:DUF4123 domain-containing protein [Trinickia terrae]TKC83815.1 DUF4123 domain-containing protein [Trinickia terrae]